MAEFGYAGEILKVDLSGRKISRLATADYSDRFLGGRGIAAKIYWDETLPEVMAFDPGNCLIFMTGPLAGFTGFAGCRCQICGKSPQMEPESFSYANLGGSWGAWLKYAGYDGLAVIGKAERPVYLSIDHDGVEIRDASHLWGKTAVETQEALQEELGKTAKVLGIGPAAENLVSFATLLAAEHAAGSSGFGSVMGSKRLKAIVVTADKKKKPAAADPVRLKSLARQVYRMRKGNFEDYGHVLPGNTQLAACYGCISGCTRGTYEAEDGREFKFFCQAAGVYLGPAMKYYGGGGTGLSAVERVGRLASRLCDEYGLDTAVLQPMIDWLGQCCFAGVLGEEETGLPLSRIGSSEFIETLVRKISYREGFGDILARGTIKAAEYVGKGARELVSSATITRASETRDFDPRLIFTNAMIYATEPRRAIQLLHATGLPLTRWLNWTEGWKDAFLSIEVFRDIAEKFWGSPWAGDLSTWRGKALAAKKVQDYGYLKESLILCDLAWPIYQVKQIDRTIGFSTLESQIAFAITGKNRNEEELNRTGERIFNLQRAILLRQGWGGREGDALMDYLFQEPLTPVFFDPGCIIPDAEGKPVSRKGAILDRTEFERLKDEYYQLRGWEVKSGLPTKSKLEELQLGDIAVELDERGLLR
jgi:aldehyde:ferredoxin oxidoreductase